MDGFCGAQKVTQASAVWDSIESCIECCDYWSAEFLWGCVTPIFDGAITQVLELVKASVSYTP